MLFIRGLEGNKTKVDCQSQRRLVRKALVDSEFTAVHLVSFADDRIFYLERAHLVQSFNAARFGNGICNLNRVRRLGH